MNVQKDQLREHDYDGIQEFDNPLPGWWLWLFWGTIIFSVIYVPYYHLFGLGPLTGEAYRLEMEEAAQLQAEKPAEIQTAEATPNAGGDPVLGREVYMTNCLACHGAKGEGGIGPNMTDHYWIHGNTAEDMRRIINEGVPAKGMVSWKTLLNPEKIENVIAFLQTLEGTNPPNAKAPQGKEYPE